ncbi:SurA N-terminal domain-containing protein [Methylocapsa acidiphila]|uniref:SurA N-terminal domain-containing protein n=1 Tax=Methylocapsa acidiphila TaxID=133552 RepID=UPI000427FC5B|nr:SurA N-terminal domain-containing protein [Methylocapsa acidiphila]
MREDLVARALGFLARARVEACVVIIVLMGAGTFGAEPSAAQTIISSINGDPVTNIDIDERMKMLRVMRKPATRDAAIESLYTDRLEIHEASKYGVNLKDSDISEEIVRVAKEMKIQPEALVAELQRAGVSADHFKAHFRADYSFNLVVQAMNKGVEASEEQVRAELAKQGGKSASGTEYKIRQVIFAVPSTATVAALNERGHEAEQLRGRFVDCETGVPLARAINDVTVRDPFTKTGIELNEPLRKLLDSTPTGHLTPPQRSSSGIEMIALCEKGAPKDDTAARNAISQKILAAHIAADAERRLKEMRARAVIVKN